MPILPVPRTPPTVLPLRWRCMQLQTNSIIIAPTTVPAFTALGVF